MTPPATAAARRSTATRRATTARTAPARRAPARRVPAPRVPRRVSGPARPAPRTAPSPLGPKLALFVTTLPDRRLVDRLLRGRTWIAVIGTLLIGLVAMQVSLLKLNAGIGRDVERSAALERRNGELRAEVSQLSAGERIQEQAAALGMVLPEPGAITYVRTSRAHDAATAARMLTDGTFSAAAQAAAAVSADNGSSDSTAASSSDGSASGNSTSSDPSTTDTSSGTSSSTDSGSTAQAATTDSGNGAVTTP